MNTMPENTQTNVVPNGHFDMGYKHWEDAGPSGGFHIGEGEWEGQVIHYGAIYKGSGITQTVPVPTPKSAGVRYSLSFLYDNRHEEEGVFILRRRGTEDELVIPLPHLGNAVAETEPKALSLTRVTRSVDFEVEADDLFEFEITSPNGSTSTISVTVALIDFHLELDPLVLSRIVNDGQGLTPAGQAVLYLCHGATGTKSHQLSFQLASGSPWAGTEALLWSQDNPLEAVLVSPDWDETQPIENTWQVDCPVPINDETLLFNLSIYSKYHADTYPIAVSLGHHRLIVETYLEPAYQPVIEYGQSVRLGVQVKSYYLDLPMRDHEVTWLLGDNVIFSDNTDEGGYAWFDFTPATEGTLAIKASVQSPFYAQGSALHTFSVKAHATDPLKAVQVKFPGMEAAPWGEKTGYPDRGAVYQMDVSFASDSPLRNLDVWLEWEGKSPEDLGVTVEPALLQPVPVTGTQLTWRLDCGDIDDGHFSLLLRCAELLKPTQSNAMSLARHSLKIGPVREANRVPVVDEGDYVWCMLQVLSLTDQPVSGVLVEWDTSEGLQRTYTGVNGWASVIDRPAVHGDYTLTARVNPREGAAELGHDFEIRTLPTSSWKTASFTLGGVAVDRVGAGVVCRMGQDDVLHLGVESGSPLIGKEVFLRWRDPASAGSIDIADMASPITITATGVDWNVRALEADTSGVFDLQLVSTDMEERDLAFRALPQDLSPEVTLVFDLAPKTWNTDADLYPCIGATHDLTILPIDDLGGLHGLLLETSLAPDLPAGWVLTPPLTESSPMTAGGVRYRCDFTGTTEAAQRSWTVKVLGVDAFTQPPAFELKLAHNKVVIGTPFEVATDPVLSKGESARLAVRYLSAFTGRPANDVAVAWDDGEASLTATDGIAQRNYQPTAAGNDDIQAVVTNPYDTTQVKHTFAVHAYQQDPWLDLKVQTSAGGEQRWGEQTFFPRREDSLDLTLSAPEDSPLLNQALTLGLSGAHELDTALSFGPVGLGVSRPLTVSGLPVRLLAGDLTDAAFYLQLSASRLLARSPLNGFSLGSHMPVDVKAATKQDLTVVDWGEKLAFEIALTNALSGQPARNVQVSWQSTDESVEQAITTTDFYGVARFSFVATVPGPGTVTASAVGETELVEFAYDVHEACVIQSLTSAGLEGYPGEDVSAEATVVSAATGEPVQGVWVHWFIKGVVLEPVATDEHGKAGITFALPPRIGRYALSASVRGEHGWDSARLVFKVLGTEDSWVQEFTLKLNERPIDMDDLVNRKMSLKDGESHTLVLSVKKDSSLINATRVSLGMQQWADLRMEFDPELNHFRSVTVVPLSWSILTKESHWGPFELQLNSPDLPTRVLPAEVNV